MFQLVLIANNGAYGGSNAHVPKGEAYQRQVFHTHGQPQATISFFEIDDIEGMKQRHRLGAGKEDGWKYPPAGCPTRIFPGSKDRKRVGEGKGVLVHVDL